MVQVFVIKLILLAISSCLFSVQARDVRRVGGVIFP